MRSEFLFGHRETDTVITMPAFLPQRICPPYHFDIKRNRQGYWIARDRDGLAGGTFLTCKDAVRFVTYVSGPDTHSPLEEDGFEPSVPREGTTFFETARFDHSGNSTPAAETGSFATRINAPQGIAGRAPGVGVDV